MAEGSSSSRHLFLLAAVALGLLAFLRLGVLLSRPMAAKGNPSNRQTLLAREITLQIKGPSGDTVRLHFPEVPLNIDSPYQDGAMTVNLKLRMKSTPHKLFCQVLKNGSLVAQSEPKTLPELEKVDLGMVEVKATR